MQVIRTEPTPNPNAFKFVVDQTLQAAGSRYYDSAAAAASNPLAKALFDVTGVETVYFAEDFATVTNAEGTDQQTLHGQVREVLSAHEGEAATAIADAVPSDDPEMLGKITTIIDERVRPALAGDGGGLQLLGLDKKVLSIRYEGACGSCPSAIGGTLMAIQNLLQVEVDEGLTVVPG